MTPALSSPGASVRSAKPWKALALRSVPSIASAADPFPACTFVAHLNTIRVYHDHSGSGTRARHHPYRRPGGSAAYITPAAAHRSPRSACR